MELGCWGNDFRTCSGTAPIVGATDLRAVGGGRTTWVGFCAIEVEGLRRRPPTVGGRRLGLEFRV